jgi:hypothetical protein
MIRIMKKSKLLAVVVLFAMFCGSFATASATNNVTLPEKVTPTVTGNAPASLDPSPAAIDEYGIWAQDLGTDNIVIDGNVTDWVDAGIEGTAYGGVSVYVAYNGSYVVVGLIWADATQDSTVGAWNKTGMIDADDAQWSFINGADDVANVGFSTTAAGTDADVWVWTASDRTNEGMAFECDATGAPDAGTVPYVWNANTTAGVIEANTKPETDNTSTPIGDYAALPNGTVYQAWFDQTTTQDDVMAVADWDGGTYYLEFARLLNTGDGDDINLVTGLDDLYFWMGVANMDDTQDMLCGLTPYKIKTTNDPASLTWDAIPNYVDESLLLQGTVDDDFAGATLLLDSDSPGWDIWYGPGHLEVVSVNEVTGEWSYLLLFDWVDLPVGDLTLTLIFDVQYESDIVQQQTFTVVDTKAPNIVGLVDLGDRYEDGVPLDEDFVTVTIGLEDDHDFNDNLTAMLFWQKNDEVVLGSKMMEQFSPGSTTFTANFTIEHEVGVLNNYSYYVIAWDLSANAVVSTTYTFSVVAAPASLTTPGFGIVIGILGAAAAAFIIKKRRK